MTASTELRPASIVRTAPVRQSLPGVAATASALLCVCPPTSAEPFVGQFELKTLESAPDHFEFQSQNAWSWGHPSRQIAGAAEGVEFDENEAVRARYALELEMGFTSALKMRIGIEFEQERFDDPETMELANEFDELELTEVGAELIAVLVPRDGNGIGFGLVAELEGPLDQEDANDLVLGTIVEFQSGRWFAAAVPMVVHSFGGDAEDGERPDNKWDFAYAAQVAYTFSDSWSLALEGYGTVERLGDTGHPSDAAALLGDFDQHRLGTVVYYTHDFGAAERPSLSVGIGLLEGLNDAAADHTLKLSIEVDF
jgi:hypothetical protein